MWKMTFLVLFLKMEDLISTSPLSRQLDSIHRDKEKSLLCLGPYKHKHIIPLYSFISLLFSSSPQTNILL